jgi:hypothetical protein
MSNLSHTWWAGKSAVVGFLAGLSCGLLVLGLGGRLVMSIIAFALRGQVEWDFGGTLQVVGLGVALGPPAGVAFSAVAGHLPGGWLSRGTVFGIACCAVLTSVYFLRPAGPVELRTAPVLGSLLFGALVITFGPVLAITVHGFRHLLTPLRPPHPAVGLAVALTTLACFVLAFYALLSR